jgi:Protein of unknown function (DUF742)
MKIFPNAKVSNIVQYETDGELLLYSIVSNKASCLNQTSKRIYDLCDGSNEIVDIAKKTKLPENLVRLAINDLSKQDLLTERIEINSSRRELLRNIALISITLPVITTLVAPAAVHAASITCTGTAPGGFLIGIFPSDINNGLNACAVPARNTCRSCTYRTGPGGSSCNNAECSSVTCVCAPVAVP